MDFYDSEKSDLFFRVFDHTCRRALFSSILEFKDRARAVRKEMISTQAVNFFATMTMLVPLWFTGSKTDKILPLSPIDLT